MPFTLTVCRDIVMPLKIAEMPAVPPELALCTIELTRLSKSTLTERRCIPVASLISIPSESVGLESSPQASLGSVPVRNAAWGRS